MPAVSTIPLTSSSPGPAGRDGINAFSFTSLDVTAYNGTSNLPLTLQNVQWSVIGQAVEVANVGTFKVLSIDSVGLVLTLQPAQVRGTPPFNIPTGTEVSPSGFPGPQGIKGDKGDKGDTGATGAPGAAATVAVGTTTTGAPGTNAAVTNAGNSLAAQFNFTIPRGDVGATGAKGDKGDQGIQGTQGAQGAQGVTGGQGPQGNPGTPGAPGVSTLATTTANGLLKQVSGKGTDFVDGTNNCQDLSVAIQPSLTPIKARPVIMGESGSPGDPVFTNAILVPRFANHPDAVWTPMGAFDDHFDGASLDPKWTVSITAGGTASGAVQNSHLSLLNQSVSGSSDTVYTVSATQSLPNNNPFTITARILFTGIVDTTALVAGHGGVAAFYVQFYSANVQGLIRLSRQIRYNATGNTLNFDVGSSYGPSAGTSYNYQGPQGDFFYVKMIHQANRTTALLISQDGFNFMNIGAWTGAATGLTANPPVTFGFAASITNTGRCQASMDWIRFTNP